jgi:Tfp pilus assembly protein PilO
MKLSPEKQKQLGMAILAVAMVLVGTWYSGTQFVTNSKVRNDREARRLADEITKRRGEILKEKSNRENAKIYQDSIKTWEARMPTGNPETWLERELNTMANRQKLSLSSTALQQVKEFSDFRFKDQPYHLLGVHIEFFGEFNQIGKFIQDVENNSPLMEVHEVSISSGSEKAKYIHKVKIIISEVAKL